MPSWLDGFRAKVMGTPPAVHLGAFGKHPGWDDHVESIGLDSEPLVAAREILYVRGIGGVVDTALWEKNSGEVLPRIGHIFCWTSEADTLIGRMWSSTDGKGRSKYPMAAVAHIGLPFSYTQAARAARVLVDVEARCREATTAPEVRQIFADGLQGLRVALAQPPDDLGAEPDRAVCTRLASGMGLNEGENFPRALYALQEEVRAAAHAPKTSGKINLKMLDEESRAHQTRFPAEGEDSVDDIAFWHKVVVADFAQVKKPQLYIHPIGYPWLDLIIGTPTARQLYAIRANETALPVVSSVPYQLDPAFHAAAAAFIAKVCDLAPDTTAVSGVAMTPPPPSTTGVADDSPPLF